MSSQIECCASVEVETLFIQDSQIVQFLVNSAMKHDKTYSQWPMGIDWWLVLTYSNKCRQLCATSIFKSIFFLERKIKWNKISDFWKHVTFKFYVPLCTILYLSLAYASSPWCQKLYNGTLISKSYVQPIFMSLLHFSCKTLHA